MLISIELFIIKMNVKCCNFVSEKRCFAQQTQARLQKDVFVPACTPDGKFEPLQCYPSGHCWCVNAIGKVVPALATGANKRPNCKRNGMQYISAITNDINIFIINMNRAIISNQYFSMQFR